MKARLVPGEQVTKDARPIAALFDQLDLHGSGLGDGDLHGNLRLGASVGASHLHWRQHVEGTDRMDTSPPRRCGQQVVDDEAELEEPELAVGPGLLEEAVVHRHARAHQALLHRAGDEPALDIADLAAHQAPMAGDGLSLLGVTMPSVQPNGVGGTTASGPG